MVFFQHRKCEYRQKLEATAHSITPATDKGLTRPKPTHLGLSFSRPKQSCSLSTSLLQLHKNTLADRE